MIGDLGGPMSVLIPVTIASLLALAIMLYQRSLGVLGLRTTLSLIGAVCLFASAGHTTPASREVTLVELPRRVR